MDQKTVEGEVKPKANNFMVKVSQKVQNFNLYAKMNNKKKKRENPGVTERYRIEKMSPNGM